MNYTIYDLIERLIDIENNALEVYKKIEENAKEKNSKNIEIITRVIRKEEIKHIKYYERLKEKFNYELNDTIDFYLYDKVVKLLYEFKIQIRIPHVDNVQDLIKYSLEFEKNSISLLLDIRGRLLGNLNDVNNNVYKIISNIIEEERRHEKMFSDLVLK
ncbi:rubrerythrin family protein [Clostridium diolis]|uniref:rubrerythrin family protein n=1 Tax=Clostridium diolis TaxID=223919 RepID=UPI000B4025F8|nr:rubrerythrin family protein [Clostridium diolis]OVE64300.1 rubrerythrin family protein [Clostridium diolis]